MKNPAYALACQLLKQADEAEEHKGTTNIPDEEVMAFLKATPAPTDDQLHQWAEARGYQVPAVEAKVYALAGKFVAGFLEQGRAQEKGVEASDTPKSELAMGKKVETEHTNKPEIAERIATDHLAESDQYYTALKQMEDNLKKQDGGPAMKEATVDTKDAGLMRKLVRDVVHEMIKAAGMEDPLKPVDATEPVAKPTGDTLTAGTSPEAKVTTTGDQAKGKPEAIERQVDPEIKLDPVNSTKTTDQMVDGLKPAIEDHTRKGEMTEPCDPSLIPIERDSVTRDAAREAPVVDIKTAAAASAAVAYARGQIKRARALGGLVKLAQEADAIEQLLKNKDNPGLQAAAYKHPHVLNALTALLTSPLALTPGGQFTHPAAAIGSAVIGHSGPRDEIDKKLRQRGIKHDYVLRHPYIHAAGSQLAGAAAGAGIAAGIGRLTGGDWESAARVAPLGALGGGLTGSIVSLMSHYNSRKRLLERLTARQAGSNDEPKTAVAKSEKQYRFMQLVKAIQEGKTEGSGKAQEAAESMDRKSVDDYTGPKPKDLPEKVDEKPKEKPESEKQAALQLFRKYSAKSGKPNKPDDKPKAKAKPSADSPRASTVTPARKPAQAARPPANKAKIMAAIAAALAGGAGAAYAMGNAKLTRDNASAIEGLRVNAAPSITATPGSTVMTR